MFKQRTLFVLGAGARYLVKPRDEWQSEFPLGRDLKEKIGELFRITRRDEWPGRHLSNNNFLLFLELLDGTGTLTHKAMSKGSEIRQGLPFSPSIDHYLRGASEEHIQLAKAAIAFILINCEAAHASDLAALDRSDLANIRLDGTWQQVFCENLFTDCDHNETAIASTLEKCRVVSFNYDRTFEFIVQQSLRGRFSLRDEAAVRAAIAKLKIVYPYGCLGSLNSENQKTFFPYGARVEADTDSKRRASVAANGIRTFDEGSENGHLIAEFVSWAERIVFLGFGFHRQNIDYLKPTHPHNPQIILGTAKGLRDASIKDLKQSLRSTFSTSIVELHDLDCFSLLEEFRHLLVE